MQKLKCFYHVELFIYFACRFEKIGVIQNFRKMIIFEIRGHFCNFQREGIV